MAKRPVGRPRKEALEGEQAELPKEKRGWFGLGGSSKKEGKVLSDKEVERLREPLRSALRDDATYGDQALWEYSKDPTKPQIWSNLDDEEIGLYVEMFLRRGQRSPQAAEFVYNVIDGADYFSIFVITIPRIIQSIEQARKRPKKPKRERKLA